MGTINNQLPYYEKVNTEEAIRMYYDIKEIQTITKCEFYEALEVYKIRLEVAKADTFDEIMSGLADILENLKIEAVIKTEFNEPIMIDNYVTKEKFEYASTCPECFSVYYGNKCPDCTSKVGDDS